MSDAIGQGQRTGGVTRIAEGEHAEVDAPGVDLVRVRVERDEARDAAVTERVQEQGQGDAQHPPLQRGPAEDAARRRGARAAAPRAAQAMAAITRFMAAAVAQIQAPAVR